MQVYKRGVLGAVKGLVLAAAAAVAAFFVVGILIDNEIVVFVVAVAVLFLLGYSAVFSENIRIELEDGELRYYQKDVLRQRFDLQSCSVRCRIRTESGFPATHDLDLYITRAGEDFEVHLDCSPLSRTQFDDLYRRIERVAVPAVSRLELRKKNP